MILIASAQSRFNTFRFDPQRLKLFFATLMLNLGELEQLSFEKGFSKITFETSKLTDHKFKLTKIC